MRRIILHLVSIFLGVILSGVTWAQYPAGIIDLTSSLSDGDASFALTVENAQNQNAKSLLTVWGDKMFFTATSSSKGDELYVTDGTIAGTKMLKDINPGGDGSPRYLTVLGDKIYFQADDGVNGVELWESDGTEAGTKMIADVYAGSASSAPEQLRPLGDKLIFWATTLKSSTDNLKWLHIYDPATGVAELVSEIQARNSGDTWNPYVQVDTVNNVAYFVGQPIGENEEIYRSDGTPSGTYKLIDVTPESLGSSGIQAIYATSFGKVFWRQKTPRKHAGADSATYAEHLGEQLWVSDGTEAGSKMVKHINVTLGGDGNGNGSQFANPFEFKNRIFFRAVDGINGAELWVSDGTSDGTYLVQDHNVGKWDNWLQDFTVYRGKLVLRSGSGGGFEGYELFYLDEETETLKLGARGKPGNSDGWAGLMTSYKYDGKDSLLFCEGLSTTHAGNELMFCVNLDGKDLQLVAQLHPDGSQPRNLTSWKNKMLFTTEKVKGLFSYQPKLVPSIKLNGSTTVDYRMDTVAIAIERVNANAFSSKVVKVEPAPGSDSLFAFSSSPDGPFGLEAIKTGDNIFDTLYFVANLKKIAPDDTNNVYKMEINFVNLEADTLTKEFKLYMEPVFRHELLYHVNVGSDTNLIENSIEVLGKNNSVFDQAWGIDEVTNKKWGYVNQSWAMVNPSKLVSGGENDGAEGLEYKFELPAGNYAVQVATYENWEARSYKVEANGEVVVPNLSVDGAGDYKVKSFTVTTTEDTLKLAFIKLANPKPWVSWFKIGKACEGDTCSSYCSEPICMLRDSIFSYIEPHNTVTNLYSDNSLMSLYPNPASNVIHVQLDADKFEYIEILDLSGKVLLSDTAEEDEFSVNVDLKDGMYFVKATGNGIAVVQKLLISGNK